MERRWWRRRRKVSKQEEEEDGVDVLSLYLGGPSSPFFEDGIALGAFCAIQKGIFVSCSAANGGPDNGTLSNEAPWILTIGASTIDRKIMATTKLGNEKVYIGESVFQPKDFAPTYTKGCRIATGNK